MSSAAPLPLHPSTGCKFVRFFRFQMAVKQTPGNRERLARGLKQMGRPTPRLISVDFEDIYQVPEDWTVLDAVNFAQNTPYFAVFLNGEYFVLPKSEIPAAAIQGCITAGKVFTLPREGIALW